MAESSSSSYDRHVAIWSPPGPPLTQDMFPDPNVISSSTLVPYLSPITEVSKSDRDEIMEHLNGQQFDEIMHDVVFPICTLAFLQHDDGPVFKACVLFTDWPNVAKDKRAIRGTLNTRLEQLNSLKLLEIFKSSTVGGGDLYVRIPDQKVEEEQTLRWQLVAWTLAFASEWYTCADLANIVLKRAVDMLGDVGPIGDGCYLPTYKALQRLVQVYRQLLILASRHIPSIHEGPRLISVKAVTALGKIILKKTEGLLDGRQVPVEVREDPDSVCGAVVERFLQLIEAEEDPIGLLKWMEYGAELARRKKAEVKLARHWQDCDMAAKDLDAAWDELKQSVTALRAKTEGIRWFP